ncbi:hypothetical protein [Lewinella sp. IMCC34183]|uniref:hypothetical protein n=1 Tax=Lewinella sp. IMCC34183 TaxID=2248762 RepID=UPI000E25B866|nr:hypothetical protein [Lewinella sp. IMCC34183]
MKHFLLKLGLLALIVFVVDKGFLLLRAEAARHASDPRLSQILEGEINKDLLIFGSSRGQRDVSLPMLEDSLGLDAFNLSYGGAEVEFQTFLLQEVVRHCEPPQVIIRLLDDDFELGFNEPNQFRYDALYPLVEYEEVREELYRRGKKNRWLSKVLVVHQLSKAAFDLRTPPRPNAMVAEYGSETAVAPWNSTWEYVYGRPPYDRQVELAEKKEAFATFQEICSDNNIQLIYVVPPSYKEMSNGFLARMREMAGPDVPILTYDLDDPAWSDSANFRDRYHLNTPGAEKFTRELLPELRTLINRKASSPDPITDRASAEVPDME